MPEITIVITKSALEFTTLVLMAIITGFALFWKCNFSYLDKKTKEYKKEKHNAIAFAVIMGTILTIILAFGYLKV